MCAFDIDFVVLLVIGQVADIAVRQGRFMVHFSFCHFPCDGVVSFVKAGWFEQIEFDVVCDFSFFYEVCGEHVAFDVLTEEVFVA